MIALGETGATYTSKGMVFTVIGWDKNVYDESVAVCLLLDDHPRFTKRIPPGTVMRVERFSSVWEEAFQLASLPEQGKVSP